MDFVLVLAKANSLIARPIALPQNISSRLGYSSFQIFSKKCLSANFLQYIPRHYGHVSKTRSEKSYYERETCQKVVKSDN